MPYTPGRLIKRLSLPEDRWLEIIARHDGTFQFHEHGPSLGSKDGLPTFLFSSGVYISAQAAEAAARLMFKL